MVMYTWLYSKWITNKDLLYGTWNSAQCYVPARMGKGFGGEWIHVYVWLSPFSVHPKLPQHCTLAIPQYKKFKTEAHIYSLNNSRGQKTQINITGLECWQGCAPSKGLRGEQVPRLFQLPVAPGFPCLMAASIPSLPPSSHSPLPCMSVFSFPLPSHIRTLVTGFRAHLGKLR